MGRLINVTRPRDMNLLLAKKYTRVRPGKGTVAVRCSATTKQVVLVHPKHIQSRDQLAQVAHPERAIKLPNMFAWMGVFHCDLVHWQWSRAWGRNRKNQKAQVKNHKGQIDLPSRFPDAFLLSFLLPFCLPTFLFRKGPLVQIGYWVFSCLLLQLLHPVFGLSFCLVLCILKSAHWRQASP